MVVAHVQLDPFNQKFDMFRQDEKGLNGQMLALWFILSFIRNIMGVRLFSVIT